MVNTLTISVISGGETLMLESKYKALFIHKFADYILERNPEKNTIKVGVLGNSPVKNELDKLITIKNNRSIKVKHLRPQQLKNLDDYHLIFLPKQLKAHFSDIYKKCRNAKTLLVSESKQLAKNGAAISFYSKDNTLKFIINQEEAIHANFIPNIELLRQAIVI